MPLIAEAPAPAEHPASGGPQPASRRAAIKNGGDSAPRPRKQAVLPQISALALEGQSCREIAATLGLRKSTVHRWLQELRQERSEKAADSTEMIAIALARYDALYREALEAWRRSQADKKEDKNTDQDGSETGRNGTDGTRSSGCRSTLRGASTHGLCRVFRLVSKSCGEIAFSHPW